MNKRLYPKTSIYEACRILRDRSTNDVLQRPRSGGYWGVADLSKLNLSDYNYKSGPRKTVCFYNQDEVIFTSKSDVQSGGYPVKTAKVMVNLAAQTMRTGVVKYCSQLGHAFRRGDRLGSLIPESDRNSGILVVGCQRFDWAPINEFAKSNGWYKKKSKKVKKGVRK